jgi:Tfp pilus assembly major pilin PilA
MNKSFTLIEVLVVVLTVGILSSIIYVASESAREKGNFAKVLMFSEKIHNSLGENIIGQWDFNEGTGSNVYDSSMNLNTGTITGAEWKTKTECVSGYCLAFGGDGDRVNIANSTVFDVKNLTISVWVYSTNFSQNGFIFEKGSVNTQYSLFFEGSYITFRNDNSSDVSDDLDVTLTVAEITNSKWHNIIAIYDGVNKKIYVDGIEKGKKSYTQTLKTGQSGQTIGVYGGGSNGYPFNGKIDELRVYDYGASVSQIRENYFIGINKLYRNKGIVLNEFNQRLTELKSNLTIYE